MMPLPKRKRWLPLSLLNGNAINMFAEKSSMFYSAFSNYFENKAKADNCSFLLQLLDKLEKGIITQQQFKDMKTSFL
jgi:hypothetical protein